MRLENARARVPEQLRHAEDVRAGDRAGDRARGHRADVFCD